jgi:hypothetical protein
MILQDLDTALTIFVAAAGVATINKLGTNTRLVLVLILLAIASEFIRSITHNDLTYVYYQQVEYLVTWLILSNGLIRSTKWLLFGFFAVVQTFLFIMYSNGSVYANIADTIPTLLITILCIHNLLKLLFEDSQRLLELNSYFWISAGFFTYYICTSILSFIPETSLSKQQFVTIYSVLNISNIIELLFFSTALYLEWKYKPQQ